jgi:hypothetical protein
MADQFDELIDEESGSGKWRESITWTSLILIGLLIYELTTQPILGVVVVCSKFGWNDFLIAFWLRKVDSNLVRARTLFWFCLASGVLKVILVSTFLLPGLIILAASFGQLANQATGLRVVSALAVTLFGYLLISMLVFRGIICARRSQTKVWLTPDWPFRGPGWRDADNGSWRNFMDALLIFALIPVGVLGFPVFPMMLCITIQPNAVWAAPFIGFCLFWCGFLYYFLRSVFLTIKKRTSTADPLECWDCDELGELMVSKISSGRRVRWLIGLNAKE